MEQGEKEMLPPRQRLNLIRTIDKINRNPNFSKKLNVKNHSYWVNEKKKMGIIIMETTIYKFKIPSKEDYYSMSFEERHTTAGIYNAYKIFFFIILKRERNSHYICVVCENHKMNKSQKEGIIKIKDKHLVRISNSCLEEAFVTNINMNSVYKKARPNYKNINKYLVFKKPKKSVNKINTSKKSKMKKHNLRVNNLCAKER